MRDGYKVASIVDPLYGLTVFSTNETYVIFVAPSSSPGTGSGGNPIQRQELPLVVSVVDKNRYPLEGIDIEIIEQQTATPVRTGKTDEFGNFSARIYTNTFYTVHATNNATGELQTQQVFLSQAVSTTVSFEFGVQAIDWSEIAVILILLVLVLLILKK